MRALLQFVRIQGWANLERTRTMGAMDRALLDGAVDRAPVNDDRRSGAALERAVLADGSRVVMKRFEPTVDLVMRLSGDSTGREVELVRATGRAGPRDRPHGKGVSRWT